MVFGSGSGAHRHGRHTEQRKRRGRGGGRVRFFSAPGAALVPRRPARLDDWRERAGTGGGPGGRRRRVLAV